MAPAKSALVSVALVKSASVRLALASVEPDRFTDSMTALDMFWLGKFQPARLTEVKLMPVRLPLA